MPAVNALIQGGAEDLRIWPAYAQAAIDAIRAIDAKTPIYVAGNSWDSAMTIGTHNPGFPLSGAALIYEVHMYLDARNTGAAFDYATESTKPSGAITPETGLNRLKIATGWAAEHKVRLALTEVGMPVDDLRWQQMFAPAAVHALKNGCEVYTWMGGDHWPIHNYAINHVPGWHQNKTLAPLVGGVMQAAAWVEEATIFDHAPGYVPGGGPFTVTLYARGNLLHAQDITLTVEGATPATAIVTLPAGPNPKATVVLTAPSNGVVTITYGTGPQVPPPRRVFCFTTPMAYGTRAGPNAEADAALAILAKYKACKWLAADAFTDYLLGVPSADGKPVRAVADSGYGSTPGNAMEMLNWINQAPNMGGAGVPVMRAPAGGKKAIDFGSPDNRGLWCKKSTPGTSQPAPDNHVPYNIEDAHFVIALAAVSVNSRGGVLFQASQAEQLYTSELNFAGPSPGATFVDSIGHVVNLQSAAKLTAGVPTVITLTCAPGKQTLRVAGQVAASSVATFQASAFNQMLIGAGYISYYPRESFGGLVWAVVAGKGAPTEAELGVLEGWLAAA
jgi:endoglucanase